MKNDFLKDENFLKALEDMNIKIQYVKIILLSFDEKPIKEIQGTIQNGGTISINGNSSLRRTISLTMFADAYTNDLTNINNLISLNKKIKIEIGYKNLIQGYQYYGDIIWFKGGTYVISSASISNSTTGSTISISGKDKMVKLNGMVGGTIPAAIILHERQEVLKDGTILISYPTLYQIITEVVTEFGEENESNIFISDLEQSAKALVKYIGTKKFHLNIINNSFTENDIPKDKENDYLTYTYGQDIGYQDTDFTFPGKLEFPAGSTVTQVLDKIISVLGNFEYFYDLDGRFIFQEKKNYLNNSYTPLVNQGTQQYVKQFSDSKYSYIFENMAQAISINMSPNYENIKNDFIIWGKRTVVDGTSLPIRFHLAIDSKPQINLADKYMWAVYTLKNEPIETKDEKTGEVINSKNNYVLDTLMRYEYTNTGDKYPEYKPAENKADFGYVLVGKPCGDWREELYRQALERSKDGIQQDYDSELLSEWRKLYNPIPQTKTVKKDGKEEQEITDWYNSNTKEAWNPLVFTSPGSLDYWLDFLDDGDDLRQYSVKAIGRRSKVVDNQSVTSIFNPEVQDILFVENNFIADDQYTAEEKKSEKIQTLRNQGQAYTFYTPEQSGIFSISSTGVSAFDAIRELIYQHLTYNCQITITCLPKYYLEPNNLIYIVNNNNGVQGSFVITSINLPLNHDGTMTIQASQALERI